MWVHGNSSTLVNSLNKICQDLKANAVVSANLRASWFVLCLLSTSWVLTLAFSTFWSSWVYPTAVQYLETWRTTLRTSWTSRRFVSQSSSLWSPASESFVFVLRFRILCIRHFVIIVITFVIRFIITFYVIYAMIYCSFCCICVWLDPGTHMIARFMSFCEPGVTEWYQSYIDCRTKA